MATSDGSPSRDFDYYMRDLFFDVKYCKQGTSCRHIYDVKGFGQFRCQNCKSNRWTSPHAWITVDLVENYVCKRWTLSCRGCGNECKPHFDEEEKEAMIFRAANRCSGLKEMKVKVERKRKRPKFGTPPHPSLQCEKCCFEKRDCIRLGNITKNTFFINTCRENRRSSV